MGSEMQISFVYVMGKKKQNQKKPHFFVLGYILMFLQSMYSWCLLWIFDDKTE